MVHVSSHGITQNLHVMKVFMYDPRCKLFLSISKQLTSGLYLMLQLFMHVWLFVQGNKFLNFSCSAIQYIFLNAYVKHNSRHLGCFVENCVCVCVCLRESLRLTGSQVVYSTMVCGMLESNGSQQVLSDRTWKLKNKRIQECSTNLRLNTQKLPGVSLV